ncbi:putative deoxyribonuclease tatdn3-A isoform X3 [Dermochelys coriacea]|uniref:putative deoxyribonuclease tatdn3-A isoform X3 n=1 Tax=Dermochelys coriacea TaxID=27794 RepID=UPI001CA932AC|nr:putative deoxyribonuclease tatdn3-A isoform X3 [Dermochelys coriacea]
MEKCWFIDCHCHLTAEEFRQDINDVIEKSKKAGVRACVSVTEQQSEFEEVIDLAERYPESVMACFGIHPIQSSANGHRSVTVQLFKSLGQKSAMVAVVSTAVTWIGLDFTPWFVSTSQQREEQQKVFALQLDIAKQLDLPVNVHSRSAGRQTIAFLKEQGIWNALLHNFAGRPSVALEGVQAGFCFSFPPAVTRNDQRAKLIRQIPLENICLETDSPSLGPKKEERNEPEKIRIACQYIAAVKEVSVETVCEVTTCNALKLFPKVHQRLKE